MSQVSPSRLDLQIPRYPSSEILSKYFLNQVPRWKRSKLLKIQEQHWHSIIPKIASYYGRFWGLGQDYWLKFLPELMNVLSGAKSQRQYGKYEKCSPKISYICLSVQFSSVSQSCPTLCDPMNRSTPGLPVHHQLPEFTQIHFHRVRDDIQPSHPRSSPSPPAPNLSQHQSLFQWVNSLHEVAKVLVLQL